MKNKIKRKLQIRFVVLAMTGIVLLIGSIVSFSIYRSYEKLIQRSDQLIEAIYENIDSDGVTDARYFVVTKTVKKEKIEVDTTHTKLVKRSEAVEYAKAVLQEENETGFMDQYRYHRYNDVDGVKIIFLSRSTSIESFQENANSLVGISMVGLGIMLCVLITVSGQVVKPIVDSHQKQKEFITSASHELKTPLTVINADVQLLQAEIGDNEWAKDIEKQVGHMAKMTEELVMLSRSEEMQDSIVKIEFPLSDVAEEVVQSYVGLAQNSGKNFKPIITPGISYCGDEKSLRQLLTILLDNAFKYCPENGEVGILLKKQGAGVTLVVANTAENINKAQLSEFTNRFYRGKTSVGTKGFGLGLSIANAIVQNHKGKLIVTAPDEHHIRISVNLK